MNFVILRSHQIFGIIHLERDKSNMTEYFPSVLSLCIGTDETKWWVFFYNIHTRYVYLAKVSISEHDYILRRQMNEWKRPWQCHHYGSTGNYQTGCVPCSFRVCECVYVGGGGGGGGGGYIPQRNPSTSLSHYLHPTYKLEQTFNC